MEPHDHSDAALLEAWSKGDACAGKSLVRRNYRHVLLFFYDKVGPEAGRDLTQSTFETLFAKQGEYRGDASVRTFLFGIARLKLVEHVRRLKIHRGRFEPTEDSVPLPELERSITSVFMGKQRETLVVRALRSLPLEDQIMLELPRARRPGHDHHRG